MTAPSTRRLPTGALSAGAVAAIRTLLWAAFPPGEEGFTEDDWEHALGGVHVVRSLGAEIVAHAAVVERWLDVGGTPVRTGYVEAVATAPSHQGHGHGTAVMREVAHVIQGDFQLGVLGTGSHGFYERLGWRTWAGPSAVRLPTGLVEPTPDEDGYLMALWTPSTPADLHPAAPITCEWRTGDVW